MNRTVHINIRYMVDVICDLGDIAWVDTHRWVPLLTLMEESNLRFEPRIMEYMPPDGMYRFYRCGGLRIIESPVQPESASELNRLWKQQEDIYMAKIDWSPGTDPGWR